LVDLNEDLTCGQQIFNSRPVCNHKILEERVTEIAAGDPNHSRRRAAAFLHFNKVNVFGDGYSVRLASLLKDLRILGTEESKIINVDGFLCEVVSKPAGKRWWKLGIDPHHKG
jgi:hypothetical protein